MSRPGVKGPARKKRGNRRRTEPVGKRVVRRALRLAKIFTIAALVPAIGYGGWLAYRFVITTPSLSVTEITVVGTERVEPARVMELAGAIDGKNIFSFDVDDVAAAVEEEPWVTRAVVKRRPPHKVEIEITERTPLALARLDDGSLYVMDYTGVVFARHASADALDLPVITGLGSKEAGADIAERALLVLVGLLKTRPGFGFDSVSEIHLDPVYGLSVYTAQGGVKLDLGINGFEEKLAAFEKIVEARSGDMRGVVSMDLSNEREVVVRFDHAVAKQGKVI